jgi:hypothetical protein
MRPPPSTFDREAIWYRAHKLAPMRTKPASSKEYVRDLWFAKKFGKKSWA